MIFGQKKRWFTLVEMLIVIVIIWVLAAALIPRLTSVRWRANDVARKADIQQLATAIITYQMDQNGKLPDPAIAWTGFTQVDVASIENQLIAAWMDWVPQDPLADNVFAFATWTSEIKPWSYGYLRIMKDGVANAWFVLMAKTQTAWWSNRVVSSDYSTWEITETSSTDELQVCKTIDKASGTGGTISAPWWACYYTTVAELRYIMVR